MKINHDLFYRDLVSEEEKALLYSFHVDMAALITGIVNVSGGQLAVAGLKHYYIAGMEEVAPMCGSIELVDKAEGFPVLKLSKSKKGYIVTSNHTNLLKRGKDRHRMVSGDPKRLVAALKGSSQPTRGGVAIIETVIADARDWRMGLQMHSTLTRAKYFYGSDRHYEATLSGEEQFVLLDMILGDSVFSEGSLSQQNKYKTAYANCCKQREVNTATEANIVDIYTKPLWVFSLSALGLIVGCVTYTLGKDKYKFVSSLETRNVLLPFTLYKDVHSIPDKALREEIIATLMMARTNRANNPKYPDITYMAEDRDNFFPMSHGSGSYGRVFGDSQSITVTGFENGVEVITFIIPR